MTISHMCSEDLHVDSEVFPLTVAASPVVIGEESEDKASPSGKYQKDILHVLISKEELHARIATLAAEIDEYYADKKSIVILTVLKGAVLFVTDLIRELSIPTELEFMAISSYGSGSTSSGVVRILKDLDRDIEGLDVLIVEDIIDSGLTLSWLLKNLATRGPQSLTVCTLLRKPEALKYDRVAARFVGFDIPNEFVVGYGLDYAEVYRDMEYIGVLKEEVYSS